MEIALNAELNSAAPLVKLEAKEAAVVGAGLIQVTYTNIGKGSALNFQCWIDHDELPHLQALSQRRVSTAVGVGESSTLTWSLDDNELPQLRLGADISAQYEDIFGRVFESGV